jgi:hypothetical protein
MMIKERESGKWQIFHGARWIAGTFETEEDAYNWADEFIDDQFTDQPNTFMPPLQYEGIATHMPSRSSLRDKITSDPDIESEAR